jgi:hypothetical protein
VAYSTFVEVAERLAEQRRSARRSVKSGVFDGFSTTDTSTRSKIAAVLRITSM